MRHSSILVACVAAAVLVAGCGGSTVQPRPGLQRVLDELVTGPNRVTPGATAYVSGPHGTWTGSAGLADVAGRVAMQPDARMRLESVSKLWTATLVLQLAGEHRLRLDDTVARHLPGLLPYGNRITLRQLLNHTSGLIDNNDIVREPERYLAMVGDPELKTQLTEVYRRYSKDPATTFPPLLWIKLAGWIPLLSEPGTTYHYSTIGYEILGLVAARVGGRPLADLYRDRIAEPLGLDSVAYDPQGDIEGEHAVGYLVGAGGKLTAATGWGTGGVGAEGGIVSNARDEARFLVGLMQGKLLKPAQLAALKTVTPGAQAGLYGLGTGVDPTCAGTAYGHNGGGISFSTSVFVSGDGKRVAVLLANGRPNDGSGDGVVHEALSTLYCKA